MCRNRLLHFFIFPTIIGVIGGLSAIVFRDLITVSSSLYGILPFHSPHNFYPLIFPVVFLFTNYVSKKLLMSSEDITIDKIAKKISLWKGGFDLKKGLIVSLLTSFNIGLGIPVGREGPIAKLGGVLSELFFKLLKVDRLHLPIYLTCGVSSAISATFNAPVAAVLFGLEIVLGRVNNYILIPLIISSSTAAVVSHEAFGNFPAFYVPPINYSDRSLLFIPIAAILFSFVPLSYWMFLKLFSYLKYTMRHIWKGMVIFTGFVVGTILFFFPEAAGVGYESVTKLFGNNFTGLESLEIFVAKFVSVALSFGSGAFGGLMSPSIFMGAFYGYGVGNLFKIADPEINPALFALTGAASVLSGVSKAPFRSSLIMIELTHSYQLVVPILLTSVLTNYFISIEGEISFLKRALLHKGIDVENVLILRKSKNFNLKDFIVTVNPLYENSHLAVARKRLIDDKLRYIPVVRSPSNPILTGIVALRNLRVGALLDDGKKIKDIMTPEPFSLSISSNFEDVLKVLALLDVNLVPVVDEKENYVGMFDIDAFLKFLSS